MSVTTSVRPSSGDATPATRPPYRVTGRRVLRSEWSKLWSLRSTWITLTLALLFLVAFGIIAAARYKSSVTSGRQMDPDFADATALSLSLFGVPVAQLALGVLGVLVTAGEYSTGTIRSTLAAVPRRLPVLWSARSQPETRSSRRLSPDDYWMPMATIFPAAPASLRTARNCEA